MTVRRLQSGKRDTDFQTGSRRDDELFGDDGRDWIFGRSGQDRLDGGSGSDRLFGQGGRDVFVHRIDQNRGARDLYFGGGGVDTLLLIGSVADYFSSSVQALAGIRRETVRFMGLWSFDIERILFQLPNGAVLDLKTDSAVQARSDSLRVTARETGWVEILGNDQIPDLVRSVSLLTPMAGVSLEFQRDPTLPGGQRAVLVFNTGSAFDGLGAGQTATRQVRVLVTDADGDSAISTVTLTIAGRSTQTPAQISGESSGALVEDSGPTTVTGTLKITDPDPGEARFAQPAAADLQGVYGSFGFNPTTGVWSFTADPDALQPLRANETVTETLTVTSADGKASQVITVTLTGSNDAPSLDGASGAIRADSTETLQGTLTVSDADAGEAGVVSFGSHVAGAYGSFTLTDQANGTAAWSYMLNVKDGAVLALGAGETLTDRVFVTTLDGSKLPLVVTIDGVNDRPTGALGQEGAAVVGNTLSVTKGDLADAEGLGNSFTYAWFRDGVKIADATGASYTLGLQDAGTVITMQASYTDGKGSAEVVEAGFGKVQSPLLQVTTLKDVVDADDGLTSLREAIANAAAKPGADEIRFHPDLEGVIHLQGSQLALRTGNDVGIFGEGRITIDANADGNSTVESVAPTVGERRAILVDGAQVTLDDLTFTGGRLSTSTDGLGGSIYAKTGSVLIEDSRFIANRAQGGGAVYDPNGITRILDSWFEGNVASSIGGGAVRGGTISGSTFTGNQSIAAGGGAVESSTVTTSSFVGNKAGGVGGAALLSQVSQSSFIGNTGSASDVFGGSVTNSLLLSGPIVGTTTTSIGNIILGQNGVTDSLQVLASRNLDPVTGHLLLKADPLNPALDRITDATGKDALGRTAIDQPSIGNPGETRDIGAVELPLVTTPIAAAITGTAIATVTEDAAGASGTLIIRDLNAGEASFREVSDLSGAYGSFTFDAATGAWGYAPDGRADALGPQESQTDSLTVTSTDGQASRTITVTITGENDRPTGALGQEGAAVVGNTLSVTKGDLADAEGLGNSFTYAWFRDGVKIADATGASYTLGLQDAGTVITVRASYTDGKGSAEVVEAGFGKVQSPLLQVTTLKDVVDADDGLTSLREAIANAAAKPGADEIRFHPDLEGVIHLQGSELQLLIGNDVGIFGEGRITIDANADGNNTVESVAPTVGERRALLVNGPAVTLDGLTFTGGRLNSSQTNVGGSIYAQNGSVLIEDSRFIANRAAIGGAVYDPNGITRIIDSWFEGNVASSIGGGGGAVKGGTISGSTFTGNQSIATGGGAVSGSTVTTSSFVGNTAFGLGDAAASSQISQSSFVGNTGNGPDVFGGSVTNSLLLSGPIVGTTTTSIGNIILGQNGVTDPLQVLASLNLDPVTGHLLLKADPLNPALDRIDDANSLDALGNRAVDLAGVGLDGLERDVGAVELLSLIA